MSAQQTELVCPKKRGLSKELRKNLVAYSFIAPNFIGFCVLTLVPVVMSFALSFMQWDGIHSPQFIGFDNFIRMAFDSRVWAAFWQTLIYVVFTVPFTMIMALLLALLLNQKIFARSFFRTVTFFPYVASIVAVAAVWNMLFNPGMGPINQILMALGVENPPKWASGSDTAMLTVVLFSIWKNMGYYMIIFLAGLQNMNPELYEAASLDGAGKWKQFWKVTLPQLAPTTFFVSIMLMISSFKVYNEVYMITGGGPGTSTLTLVLQIYNEAFIGSPEYGYSSAISMVLFLLVLMVTVVQFIAGQEKDGKTQPRRRRRG